MNHHRYLFQDLSVYGIIAQIVSQKKLSKTWLSQIFFVSYGMNIIENINKTVVLKWIGLRKKTSVTHNYPLGQNVPTDGNKCILIKLNNKPPSTSIYHLVLAMHETLKSIWS